MSFRSMSAFYGGESIYPSHADFDLLRADERERGRALVERWIAENRARPETQVFLRSHAQLFGRYPMLAGPGNKASAHWLEVAHQQGVPLERLLTTHVDIEGMGLLFEDWMTTIRTIGGRSDSQSPLSTRRPMERERTYGGWVQRTYPDWIERLFEGRLPHQKPGMTRGVIYNLIKVGFFGTYLYPTIVQALQQTGRTLGELMETDAGCKHACQIALS